MKFFTRWFLVLLLPVFTAPQALAEDYKEGTEYLELATPQSTANKERIEVVELFWYGCPHCFRLEPFLADWLANKPDDVDFIRLPAILGPSWDLLAKAWFTADLLGVTDKTHTALFKAIHEQKKKINSEDKLRTLFARQGVSADDFNKTFKSFAVAIKLNNARLMTKRYAVTGVPTLIINGKFSTGASRAGGNAEVIKVVNYLVDQERKLAASPAESGLVTASQ